MAVQLVTSVGELVIDLFTNKYPIATQNFLKLCKIKYYNYCLFHSVPKDFIAHAHDCTNSGSDSDSIFKFPQGIHARLFCCNFHRKCKHNKIGIVAMASGGENENASQFYITTSSQLSSHRDGKHTIFGEIGEGQETLVKINEACVLKNNRAYVNIKIKCFNILYDPFDDMPMEVIVSHSPTLKHSVDGTKDEFIQLKHEDITMEENDKIKKDVSNSTIFLELVGDLPIANIKPPDNVLFVCKLNPVTEEDDLEIIFGRFGQVKSTTIIRDFKTNDNSCYAFVEFETKEACEDAILKMDNAFIDDQRIHVDFSHNVSHLWKLNYRM